MKSIPLLLGNLLAFIGSSLALETHILQAQEFDLGLQKSERVQEITGNYAGEVRLQNSTGDVDRILNPNVKVQVSLSLDSVQLISPTDLIGNRCASKIGAIRELKKFANDESQILTAEFGFFPGKCFPRSKINNLTLLFWKNDKNEIILETLLDHYSERVDVQEKNSLYIHGYFTKSGTPAVKARNPTVAKVAS